METDTALRTDLASALDPVVFARSLGIEPDPWQADVLRTIASRAILVCGRQVGKSTAAALKTIHRAIYYPCSLILLVSPSLRQSSELFRKVIGWYRVIEDDVPMEAESALRLELRNGSRIVSLPGLEATIRCYSGVDLLIIDEAARASDVLYTAVRPMLAVSGGQLMLLSSPFGQQGFFYDAWENGGADWLRVRIRSDECPRISPEFLEQERRSMPDWAYRSEYEAIFTQTTELLAFFREDLERAFDGEEVEEWDW